jgi:glycosyltransferase involved in cell wall biosynthesis
MQDKITVAIPTFNRPELCKRAVESCLIQEKCDYEIIVSDNSENTATEKILENLINLPRVRYYKNKRNLGMSANWDNCLEHSTGKYFLLLSDDDFFNSSDSLSRLVSPYKKNDENIGFVFSNVRIANRTRNLIANSKSKARFNLFDLASIHFDNAFSIFPCSTLFRVKDIKGFGGYTSFKSSLAIDTELWLRVLAKYESCYYINEPLLTYWSHSSLSKSNTNIWVKDLFYLKDTISSLPRLKKYQKKELQKKLDKKIKFIEIYERYLDLVSSKDMAVYFPILFKLIYKIFILNMLFYTLKIIIYRLLPRW